ncbi:MAG: anaerobic ribonucleoside-triphosphate reductase activating protein [Gammaproteobacteria bacterium]|nr:MAG: anaerobic ribonucleoside-triphosphate reductase activating protein [Gammaproteobacteria bacterium]
MRNANFSPSAANGPDPVIVGGYTPLTTIDYPQALSAVLFLQGCPWRCGYCHNGGLIAVNSPATLPWRCVLDFLEKRRMLLDAVVFSGGEPTLQAGLGDAMRQVRALGFRVGLHTAGIYPRRLEKILPLVDWVGMDVKSAHADYDRITGARRSAARAWQSLRLILASGVAHEFRTTVHPDVLNLAQLDNLFCELAESGAKNVVVQDCVTEHCRDLRLRRCRNPRPAAGFFARFSQWFDRLEIRRL